MKRSHVIALIFGVVVLAVGGLATLVLALAGIGLQLVLWLWTRCQFQMPLTLWWLVGTGGLVAADPAVTAPAAGGDATC